MTELAIVGAGPAGISAFIEAARLGIDAIVIEKDSPGGTVSWARKIENFPPFPPISGKELAGIFRKRFIEMNPETLKKEVVEIVASGSLKMPFKIVFAEGDALQAGSIVLAPGQENILPPDLQALREILLFPGECRPEGGEKVTIYGGGDAAFDQALLFNDNGSDVELFCRSRSRAKPLLVAEAQGRGIMIHEGYSLRSAERSGNGVTAVFCGGGERMLVSECRKMMAALGKEPPRLKIMGGCLQALLKEGVSERGGLPVKGIFAAGDVRRGRDRNVAVAVADGILAASGVRKWLKGE